MPTVKSVSIFCAVSLYLFNTLLTQGTVLTPYKLVRMPKEMSVVCYPLVNTFFYCMNTDRSKNKPIISKDFYSRPEFGLGLRPTCLCTHLNHKSTGSCLCPKPTCADIQRFYIFDKFPM